MLGFLSSSFTNIVLILQRDRANCSTLPYQLFTLLTIRQNNVTEIVHMLLFRAIVITLMGIGDILHRWARHFGDGN
jgi:hypothetical protein